MHGRIYALPTVYTIVKGPRVTHTSAPTSWQGGKQVASDPILPPFLVCRPWARGENTSLRADYASGAGLCGRCCCCLWWVVLVGGCACVWAVVRGWLWMVRQLCARVNVAVVVFVGGAAGGGGGGEDGGGGGGAGAGWGGKR